ncbi:MAG: type II toxin-antitoxin system VapC family toxin [Desulfobulbus sp.]|jgi:predicted nucleic acid-binding protein|uniref:type II toxin-antitoxin system VapC family toxin n=1 Tax=Desulfobulbus sp. TaxID=895 RepID=UPI0028511764|nr:type II toxin-antitoxin system VapC family toxin [Desulfobulbus sp.]MDR2548607.1 type II toxin-antitoxin system VapC family toxin [Desulfobulbus sp.]
MIVVDTNILAYLYLPCEFTSHAERLLLDEREWAAPLLWRSEFRNILTGYMRRGRLSLAQAMRLQNEAESLLVHAEYEVNSADVLALADRSDCSAYDCEFVALAMSLRIKAVTMDSKLLRAFPETTLSLVAC